MPNERYIVEECTNVRVLFKGSRDFVKYVHLCRALLKEKHGCGHSEDRVEPATRTARRRTVKIFYNPIDIEDDYASKETVSDLMTKSKCAKSIVDLLNTQLTLHNQVLTIIFFYNDLNSNLNESGTGTKYWRRLGCDACFIEYDLKKHSHAHPVADNGPLVIFENVPESIERATLLLHELGHALQYFIGPNDWLTNHRIAIEHCKDDVKLVVTLRNVIEQDNVDRHEDPIRDELYKQNVKYKYSVPHLIRVDEMVEREVRVRPRVWYSTGGDDESSIILGRAVRTGSVKWMSGFPWHGAAYRVWKRDRNYHKIPQWKNSDVNVQWVKSPPILPIGDRTQGAIYKTDRQYSIGTNRWHRTGARRPDKRSFKPLSDLHLQEIYEATQDLLYVLDINLPGNLPIKLRHNNNYYTLDEYDFLKKVNELKRDMPGEGVVEEDEGRLFTGFCGRNSSGKRFVLYNKRRFGEGSRMSNNPALKGWYIPSGANYHQQIHAVVHESLHLHSYNCRGFINDNWHDSPPMRENMDEGVTEMFARLICSYLSENRQYTADPEMVLNGYMKGLQGGFLPVYEGVVEAALILCHVAGVKAVAKAYFLGEFEALKNTLKAKTEHLGNLSIFLFYHLGRLKKENASYMDVPFIDKNAVQSLVMLSRLTAIYRLGPSGLKRRVKMAKNNRYYNTLLRNLNFMM